MVARDFAPLRIVHIGTVVQRPYYPVDKEASKRPGREADHPSSSSAKAESGWSYAYPPPPHYVYISWRLINDRDKFAVVFTPSCRDEGPAAYLVEALDYNPEDRGFNSR